MNPLPPLTEEQRKASEIAGWHEVVGDGIWIHSSGTVLDEQRFRDSVLPRLVAIMRRDTPWQ